MQRIGLILPVMRISYKQVLADLVRQTIRPDVVRIVDNNNICQGEKLQSYPFRVEYFNYGRNIGTNAAWNYMQDLQCMFTGVVGDDYRISRQCLESLVYYLELGATAVTSMIKKDTAYYELPYRIEDARPGVVRAKGHCGLLLMNHVFVELMPLIPKQFFIFFGDNWIGYWLEKVGQVLYEVPVPIFHQYKTDLAEKLDYRAVLAKERKLWHAFLEKGEI